MAALKQFKDRSVMTLFMERDEEEAIRRIAVSDGRSIAAILRIAVREYLARNSNISRTDESRPNN